MRKDYKLRLPQHNTLIEIKKFVTFHDPRTAYFQAPLGIALLRTHLNSELKMELGTNFGIQQTEMALGAQSIRKYLGKIKLRRLDTAQKLTAKSGVGWTREFLNEVLPVGIRKNSLICPVELR